METAEPVRRTSEIEEVTNLYVIHPIAARLVPLLAALRIPPNAVSLAGMLFGALAGVAYYHYQEPRYVVAGFLLMVAWHVMDGADGQLARLTNAQSRSGKILDGICDYVTFIAVYSGLAITLGRDHGERVWLLALVAGVCHAVQSAAYEVQRQEFNYWGLGRQSAALQELTAAPQASGASSLLMRAGEALHRLYVKVQLITSGVTPEFHDRLARTLEQPPERVVAVRRRYREIFAPLVRRWSVMSANYRTIGIFLFALAQAPEYYFWFEIVGFSLISMALLRQRRARYALFFGGLESAPPRSAGLAVLATEEINGHSHQH
jgi:phosphatidylglycerophosphate synthase